MSLEIDDLKQARDEIKAIIDDLKVVYKNFEDTLKTKDNMAFLFGEIYRHAEELVFYLTDEKIEEEFKVEELIK